MSAAYSEVRLGCTQASLRDLCYGMGSRVTNWTLHPHDTKGEEWLTLEHGPQQLGVRAPVTGGLTRDGPLPARQVVPLAPWVIPACDLPRLAVQTEIQAV